MEIEIIETMFYGIYVQREKLDYFICADNGQRVYHGSVKPTDQDINSFAMCAYRK